MRLIYLLISAFFIFLTVIAYYHYKRKNIGLSSFTILGVSYFLLAIFSLLPGATDAIAGLIGMNVRINFIIFMLIVVMVSFIFIQVKSNNLVKRDLNRITQLLGINRLYVGLPSPGAAKFKKTSNILVKMAAFNEEKNISKVLENMPDSVDVLVIDDGSNDSTKGVADEYGSMIVSHERNMGQGMADLTGFKVAFDMDYEYIVEMDADGQHNPAEISLFIRELEEHPELDIIVGSRILGTENNDASFLRSWSLPFYTRMINWASGYSLTDGMCGFKAYRAESLLKYKHIFRDLIETEYIGAELYIRFGREGLRISEIPVHVVSRSSGKSHKGTFRYGFAVVWVIMRAVFGLR